jgi:hypothetical protein
MRKANRPYSGLSFLSCWSAGIAGLLILGGIAGLLIGMSEPVPKAMPQPTPRPPERIDKKPGDPPPSPPPKPLSPPVNIKEAMEGASSGVVPLSFAAGIVGLGAALLLLLLGVAMRGAALTRTHTVGALAALILSGGAVGVLAGRTLPALNEADTPVLYDEPVRGSMILGGRQVSTLTSRRIRLAHPPGYQATRDGTLVLLGGCGLCLLAAGILFVSALRAPKANDALGPPEAESEDLAAFPPPS